MTAKDQTAHARASVFGREVVSGMLILSERLHNFHNDHAMCRNSPETRPDTREKTV